MDPGDRSGATRGPDSIPGADGVPSDEFELVYGKGVPAWCIGRPQSVVLDALERGWLSKGPILDSGCGTGENLIAIGEARPGVEMLGVDLVPVAIDQARERVVEAGMQRRARLVAADLRDASREGPFGSILDAGVLHVFSDRDRHHYLARLREMLMPGGELVIIVFSVGETTPGGPRRFERVELLESLSEAGFTVTDIESCRYETTRHEGGAQSWLARSIRT